MRLRRLVVVMAIPAVMGLVAGTRSHALGDELKELRVCSDPDNLPFSNQRLEGFENKIADVIAQDLGLPLQHYWWPHQRGLLRNTLRAGACDILIGIPKGYDPVLWTKPYYRSAYVLVHPVGKGLKITSLADPALRQFKRIGVHLNTPPYDVLAEHGLQASVVGYPLFFDHRDPDPAKRPFKLLQDVVTGEVDVAVAWGPVAGYFARQAGPPGRPPVLEVVPLADEGVIPMTFEVSMGVKKGEQALKVRLEEALDRRQAEIRRILDEYGVPLLPLKPPRSAPTGDGAGPGAPPAGGPTPPK